MLKLLSAPPNPLRPLFRSVTYTRWLHLLVAVVVAAACVVVFPGVGDVDTVRGAWLLVVPLPLLVALGLLPRTRLAEGMQAQLLLFPAEGEGGGGQFGAAPSRSWGDRGRTVLWLVLRYELGMATAFLSVHLPTLVVRLLGAAGDRWWCVPAALGCLVLLPAFVIPVGAVAARAARALLGPSAAERLAALEARTERLLEHNRLARELHDSVGHALTVMVVQAGAARAVRSEEFTQRALEAVEESGRQALEELDRVLKVLREDVPAPARRPSLAEVERLLAAARGSGAEVDAEVTGAPEAVPGPVSREGYRILQEALTNVVRHAGAVPVSVRIAAGPDALELEIRNGSPTGAARGPAGGAAGGSGSGLRGIRERAALLGGRAEAGPDGDGWRVRAVLPFDGALGNAA
ncbi:two-component sensor histidine kinase [Streptomyces mashuensis]|uniref:histidine kinase n=1 Tax=Streptomyces mashuensis TaxID=33904 RepID=A0A919AXU0_9ACTN|nr:histidine kinase [Streptomyces mashuensis]GHF30270.1 two-component sensor histidine kinase [Streptomyces mashuensis]